MVALVFFALIAAGSIFVGIRYVRIYRNAERDETKTQEFVKKNAQGLWVNDPKETEIENVYVVKHDKLGFNKESPREGS